MNACSGTIKWNGLFKRELDGYRGIADARRVAVTARAERLDEIGAAIPLGLLIHVRLEAILGIQSDRKAAGGIDGGEAERPLACTQPSARRPRNENAC
jgi:hypothetical protein